MFPSRIASRLVRWGPALLAACVLALYLATLSPGVTFTDGPELLTAVVSLGVAHPTGYPLFILAGHAFCKLLALPLPAYLKMETFNALCGAGAAFFAAITTRDLARLAQARSGRGDARDATLGGLAAGLLMAMAPLVWEEVRIPEVYALHLFLATWAGYAWTRFEVTGRTGYVLGAALPMGIGLAHHVTMVYMLPAAFLYLMVRRPSFFVTWITTPAVRLWRRLRRAPGGPWRAGWWGFPVACVVGFLPLLSYGFLIWANQHTTGVSWGGVHDWDSLYGHFTGRQYQGFMTSLDRAGHVARIRQLPSLFDAQFLPAGTVLFFVGLLAAFRRIRRPALFFFAYGLFNVAHGAHYGVGDYGTYYLPAIYTCAVFMGIGLAALMGIGRRWPAARRASAGLVALGLMLAGGAASIAVYARFFPRRLPAALAAHPAPLVVPLGVLAALAFAGAVGSAVRPRRPLPSWALPAVLAGGLLASLAPVAVARAHDQNSKATVGESYGAEVAGHLPPGAVFMTQGDGFLFTMWYENHVQGRATDVATVDMGNLRTPWFQHYVFARSPVACDPLGPEATLDSGGVRAPLRHLSQAHRSRRARLLGLVRRRRQPPALCDARVDRRRPPRNPTPAAPASGGTTSTPPRSAAAGATARARARSRGCSRRTASNPRRRAAWCRAIRWRSSPSASSRTCWRSARSSSATSSPSGPVREATRGAGTARRTSGCRGTMRCSDGGGSIRSCGPPT